MSSMIEVDGSYLEGGGQILRTACSLSAITKRACHVFNIRQGRPKPGLATQHLLAIQSLAQLCQGRLEGDTLGSGEVKFYPSESAEPLPQETKIKIETAGSIALVLQAILPFLLLAPSPVKLIFQGGATDTFFSPTIDYFQYVFLKIIGKMDGKAGVNILRRGYYPEGGAKVEVTVSPSKLKHLNSTERGNLLKLRLLSGASESLRNKKVAERQLAGVKEVLGKLNLPTEEKTEYYQTQSPGSQICLIAEFENTVIGTDNLGKMGKRAEDVGKEAALELLEEQKTDACLDKHLADQVLPYLALAKSKSQVTVSAITNHIRTNIWVIEKFLDGKFKIKDDLITWLSN